jgi:predicted PurR-regulated permease PerM
LEQRDITLQTIAIPVVAIMIMTLFFYHAKPVMVPVVLGIVFAFILNPAIRLLMNFKFPRIVAVLLTVLLTLVIFLSLVALITAETTDLVTKLPAYWTAFQAELAQISDRFPSLAQLLPGDVADKTVNPLQNVKFKDIASFSSALFKGLGSAFSLLGKTIIILMLTTFILLEQSGFKLKLATLFGSEHSQMSQRIVDQISSNISGYLAVKFLTSFALGVVVTIGLLIFGVPYAYVWGPLAGALNLIPYFGAIIGAIPPMIVASIEYSSLWWMLYVGLFFLVVQFLEGNVITPKLAGDRVNLNLTAVLIATLYWGWLWGGVGVMLALPITATFKVICDHIEPLRPIGNLLEGKFKG